eukprot:NODE_9_length_64580_cov_1.431941.p22 type:complete len:335 gc:universal NODE_9_length_64580_cov_1.431941:62960-61956(-)
MGIELAQVNLAYLIDKEEIKQSNITQNLKNLALLSFHRAANQGNVDARIKAGDYHYNGNGIEEDRQQAFEYYKAASESRSSYAAWNIGYMYENGIGVKQDFNMAMRFYDLAYEYNKDTWLVVSLSNLKLRLRWSWNDFLKYFQNNSEESEEVVEEELPISKQHKTEEIDWEIDEMRTPTWKRNNYNDGFSTLENMFFGSSSAGMDNLIFFALILVSGYLFYIRRRNQVQLRAPTNDVPVVEVQSNARLNSLLEQMREQQRQRLQENEQMPTPEPIQNSPIEETLQNSEVDPVLIENIEQTIPVQQNVSAEELRKRRLQFLEQVDKKENEEPEID